MTGVAHYFAIISWLQRPPCYGLGDTWTADSWIFMTCYAWSTAEHSEGVASHAILGGIAGRSVPGQVQRDAIFSISERLHKRIASLRFGWNADAEEKRLLLLRSKRREKSYDCTLRLRFCDPLLPARFEEERLLDAEIAAENQRWTLLCSSQPQTKRLDCFLPHRSTWKRLHLPADYYGQLFIPETLWDIKLAYIIVVVGQRLKRTPAKFDLVRTVTDSVFICVRLLYVDNIVLDLYLLYSSNILLVIVRPTQPVEIFDNVSSPFGTWPPIDIHGKFYEDRPRGTSPSGQLNTEGYSQI